MAQPKKKPIKKPLVKKAEKVVTPTRKTPPKGVEPPALKAAREARAKLLKSKKKI